MLKTHLYLEDSYTKCFEATIIDLQDDASGTWIELNHTYFYPEGGGQPNDIGTIGGLRVLDVQSRSQRVMHLIDAPLESIRDLLGQNVSCAIDWDRRYDLMCQHSGQHVLSAILDDYYKTATVGFHLTPDNLTIDTDTHLAPEAWQEIEVQCNAWLQENLPMKALYPTADSLSGYALRKQPKYTENIRLVALGDKDIVPCGGTHVAHTGEIGYLKLLKVEKYKGGQRVFFCCGKRAVKESQRETTLVRSLCQNLSVTPDTLVETVALLGDKVSRLNYEKGLLEQQIANMLSEELLRNHQNTNPKGPLIYWSESYSPEIIKAIIQLLTQSPHLDGTLLMGYSDDKGGQFVLRTGPNQDAAALLREVKNLYPLKGGGNQQRIQGGGQDIDQVKAAFKWLSDNL